VRQLPAAINVTDGLVIGCKPYVRLQTKISAMHLYFWYPVDGHSKPDPALLYQLQEVATYN
jgi:hypothetical protein